jgi:deoxyribodipyrimidine photo-lyase
MLVSFTHNLWQPWQEATSFIPNVLDFELIHFPKLQCKQEKQVSTCYVFTTNKKTVMNTIQKENLYENGFLSCKIFRATLYMNQYKMTYLDQKFNDFEVGVDYPNQLSIWKN